MWDWANHDNVTLPTSEVKIPLPGWGEAGGRNELSDVPDIKLNPFDEVTLLGPPALKGVKYAKSLLFGKSAAVSEEVAALTRAERATGASNDGFARPRLSDQGDINDFTIRNYPELVRRTEDKMFKVGVPERMIGIADRF